MKKFVKYSLYGLTYVVIIFFLAVMFIVTAKADLIEPNNRNETSTRSIDLNCIAWAITTNPVIKIVTNKDVPGINLVGIPIK